MGCRGTIKGRQLLCLCLRSKMLSKIGKNRLLTLGRHDRLHCLRGYVSSFSKITSSKHRLRIYFLLLILCLINLSCIKNVASGRQLNMLNNLTLPLFHKAKGELRGVKMRSMCMYGIFYSF
jgi:hypothetical protein